MGKEVLLYLQQMRVQCEVDKLSDGHTFEFDLFADSLKIKARKN